MGPQGELLQLQGTEEGAQLTGNAVGTSPQSHSPGTHSLPWANCSSLCPFHPSSLPKSHAAAPHTALSSTLMALSNQARFDQNEAFLNVPS